MPTCGRLQFRAVQKCLLLRFKDSKPSALGDVPLLLDETCNQLADLADRVDQVDRALVTARCALACGTSLILTGLRCAPFPVSVTLCD